MHHRATERLDPYETQSLLGSGKMASEKLDQTEMDQDSEQIIIEQNSGHDDFPMPSWIWARSYQSRKRKRILPQAIAHRGYKAENPENTMKSFKGAVEVGAHAIETDIHLTKDNVVVLSHDADLKRCFGRPNKIIDCNWDEVSRLRTLRAPHEPMPQLRELLEYVSSPELDHIWLFLDIKLDNNADDVMRLIAETLNSVDPGNRAWKDRVVLGIWAAKYLTLCARYLPGYPISYIGFSTCYARQFLKVPNISFNMLQRVLLGPIGNRFIHDVQKAHRPLFVWTVNDTNIMKWSIQKKVDGVITDDPKKFRQVCDEWDDETEPIARANLWQWITTLWLYCLIAVYIIPFRRRFPETVEQFIQRKQLRAKGTLKLGA